MVRPRPLQFSLRATLLTVAIARASIGLWRWYAVRHMRELARAIQACRFGGDEEALLTALAWNETAWETSLFKALARPAAFKRLVWNSSCTLSDGTRIRVFLFDSFVAPTADLPLPLTCVVTDEKLRLVYWDTVGDGSRGFVTASIEQPGDSCVLKLTVRANFFRGEGTYRYTLTQQGLISGGKPKWVPTEEFPAPFLRDPPELRDVLPRIREA